MAEAAAPVIEFFVPGTPISKARARTYRMKNGKIGSYTPDRTTAWEAHVQLHAKGSLPEKPLDGALRLDLTFLMPATKVAIKKKRVFHSVRPDIDNLEKAVMDALNRFVWIDDAQVCQKVSQKIYTQDMREEGVRVRIWDISKAEAPPLPEVGGSLQQSILF